MELLFGTHGTSKSRQLNIQRDGFVSGSAPTKASSGIYFWAYETTYTLAADLAEHWWACATQKRAYHGDNDQALAIIYVSIKTEKKSFCDCTHPDFQSSIWQIVKDNPRRRQRVGRLHDYLLRKIEQETGCKIDVVKVSLKVPQSPKTTLTLFHETAMAYIVRNNRSDLITILDCA